MYLRDGHPRSKKIRKELKYFRRNRRGMTYAKLARADFIYDSLYAALQERLVNG